MKVIGVDVADGQRSIQVAIADSDCDRFMDLVISASKAFSAAEERDDLSNVLRDILAWHSCDRPTATIGYLIERAEKLLEGK